MVRFNVYCSVRHSETQLTAEFALSSSPSKNAPSYIRVAYETIIGDATTLYLSPGFFLHERELISKTR